ncbi:MAG: cation transporter [Bacteroidetes bacterium HGW-Bacteroidetes-21]|jgi:cation diffusion facilitator family transporter|nr:MAG: cation transporter [Bacteroidetes bacterium HGW-Bacteroidetes-21]
MDKHQHDNEKRTAWVVLLTAVTMVVEITYGLTTGSMALLADGIHMGSHVLAIGLSWLAYVFIRQRHSFKVNNSKVLSLSGFTSGMLLLVFAIMIIWQAADRFIHPQMIQFKYAIIVAIIGLVVNIASVFLLHHDHEHSDHNIKAAYLHVLADALTSISAIIGLLVAWKWDIMYVDTVAALISSLVIIKWSVGLLLSSGKELLDYKKEG